MKNKGLSVFIICLLLLIVLPVAPVQSLEVMAGEPVVECICGSNRYGTAVAVSKKGWVSSDTVVLARGDDYADVSVPADSALSIVLEYLGQLYEVTFTVTNDNGDPIEDAWIWVDRGDYWESGYTNSSGNLTLNLPVGDYDYGVRAEGFTQKYGTFSVPEDLEHHIVLANQGTDDNSAVWLELQDYWSESLPVILPYANQYYDFCRTSCRYSLHPIPRFYRNNLRYFQAAPYGLWKQKRIFKHVIIKRRPSGGGA